MYEDSFDNEPPDQGDKMLGYTMIFAVVALLLILGTCIAKAGG